MGINVNLWVVFARLKTNKDEYTKLEIAINQLNRVHRDMNDCANRFILKDAINQLQEQVELFSIQNVAGQSEQLVCDKCSGFVYERLICACCGEEFNDD